ncbi:MAG TPA: DUF2062 domain-containing protein [Thermopetrobacter sp.]|nr:DUF2062 domain-containing protein [Thermopetrobacter sp.]
MFARRKRLTLPARIRNFLFPRGGLRRAYTYIWYRARRISATPHKIALGFACGAFVSFTPFIGFHFILAGIAAWLLRGSIIASAFGTSVGNPLTFPFIWWATYNLGGLLLGYESRGEIDIALPHGVWHMLLNDPAAFGRAFWDALGPLILPMTVGAVPLGGLCAAACYFLVRPAVWRYQERRRRAIARRITRQEPAE